MEEMNNVTTNEIENVDVYEVEDCGKSGMSKVALGAGIATLGVAAVYGAVQLAKKGKAAWKRHQLVKEAEAEIDNVDSFEDFDEQVAEIHEKKK